MYFTGLWKRPLKCTLSYQFILYFPAFWYPFLIILTLRKCLCGFYYFSAEYKRAELEDWRLGVAGRCSQTNNCSLYISTSTLVISAFDVYSVEVIKEWFYKATSVLPELKIASFWIRFDSSWYCNVLSLSFYRGGMMNFLPGIQLTSKR